MEEVVFAQRKNTGSVKWDMMLPGFGSNDLLPMWIADMDFRVPECVTEALTRYIQTGVHGYSFLGVEFMDAFVRWEQERHGFSVDKSWLSYTPGVVAALNWAVQAFAQPGEGVVVLTPVYPQFLGAVRSNGRKLLEVPLVRRGSRYEMDLPGIEGAIRQGQGKLLLLCSPHNPVGRVWSREELEALLALCREYGVIVVSDEIHQDITLSGKAHIPICALEAKNTVILTAPSKTFNLAGFCNALAIIPDDDLRQIWRNHTAPMHIDHGNTLGYVAGAAAYRQGGAWNRAVCRQVLENHNFLRQTLLEKYPLLQIPEPEGTYLMWIDFGAYLKEEQVKPFFQEKCRIAVNYGSSFGSGCGTCVRFNLATSPEIVRECAKRILENL